MVFVKKQKAERKQIKEAGNEEATLWEIDALGGERKGCGEKMKSKEPRN